MNILYLGSKYLLTAFKDKYQVISAGLDTSYDIQVNTPFCDLEKDILSKLPPSFTPDIMITFEGPGMIFPQGIETSSIPKAWHAMDSHVNLNWHIEYASVFDYLFICQKDYLKILADHTNAHISFTPLSCNPLINKKLNEKKIYDMVFVGTVDPTYYNRMEFLGFFKQNLNIQIFAAVYAKDMNRIFNQAKIILNHSIKNDLNFRIFEALASGSLVLTPNLSNGFNELFINNEDLISFDPANLNEGLNKARYFLNNVDEREAIAKNGYNKVMKYHSHQNRIDHIMNFINHHPISSQKKTSDIYKHLGNAYYLISQLDFNLGKQKKYKADAFNPIIKMYQKHIKNHPCDIEGYNFLALNIKKDTFPKASQCYQESMPSEAQNVFTLLGLAFLALKFNQKKQALHYFHKSLHTDYNNAFQAIEHIHLNNQSRIKGLVNLGQLYGDLKMFDESINYFQHAVNIENKNHELHTCLGFLFLSKKDFPKAKKSLTDSLMLNPNQKDLKEIINQL